MFIALLGELGNGVDGSLFADDLTIYITTKNQRVATRALQGVTNRLEVWAAGKNNKYDFQKEKKEK